MLVFSKKNCVRTKWMIPKQKDRNFSIGVFRILSNFCDVPFLRKYLTAKYFRKKAPRIYLAGLYILRSYSGRYEDLEDKILVRWNLINFQPEGSQSNFRKPCFWPTESHILSKYSKCRIWNTSNIKQQSFFAHENSKSLFTE